MSIVAPPSSKKSFVAVNIAACIATGKEFFGHAVRKGNVLYAMAEGQAGIQKRLRAWEIFNGVDIADGALGLIPEALPLNIDIAVAGLIEAANDHAERFGSIDLMIVDTVNRSLEGDENSAKDMTSFVRNITNFINEIGAAVLVVHHPSKSGHGGARGHSALHGAVDVGLEIKNGGQPRFTLKCDAKPPKDDEPASPLTIHSRVIDLSDEFGFDDEGHPISSLALELSEACPNNKGLKPTRVSEIQKVGELITTLLRHSCLKRSEIVEAVMRQGFEGNARTIDRALAAKVTDGMIVQPSHGTYELADVSFDTTD